MRFRVCNSSSAAPAITKGGAMGDGSGRFVFHWLADTVRERNVTVRGSARGGGWRHAHSRHFQADSCQRLSSI